MCYILLLMKRFSTKDFERLTIFPRGEITISSSKLLHDPEVLFKSEAQTFTVYNYSVAEGLPSSEVYQVYQDRTGFLWFATDNGVVKFDGSQMTTYHTKDGLSDPVVFGFHEDSKDRLWFRTFSGQLSYFENGKIIKYSFNHKLPTFKVAGLLNFAVGDQNELWFTEKHAGQN